MVFKKRSQQILEQFNQTEIIKSSIGVNFFGQESLSVKQIRGNGVLILTEYQLFFEMWAPKRQVKIPLKMIITIDTPKWHLKKSKSRPLLKVNYYNEMGKIDSCAWLVRDLKDWLEVLQNMMEK
ncbi:MAG: hypothetical protein ACFFDW_05110 [Candidatus Thorarchaeota archaeon]